MKHIRSSSLRHSQSWTTWLLVDLKRLVFPKAPDQEISYTPTLIIGVGSKSNLNHQWRVSILRIVGVSQRVSVSSITTVPPTSLSSALKGIPMSVSSITTVPPTSLSLSLSLCQFDRERISFLHKVGEYVDSYNYVPTMCTLLLDEKLVKIN